MMTKDEALKLALEAFEYIENNYMSLPAPATKAINAIREALAQPEQEPVAHTLNCICGAVWDVSPDGVEEMVHAPNPPQRKPLTDEEIILIVADCASSHQHTDIHFARAIEAAHGIWPENSDCYGPDWTDRDGEYLK